MKNSSIAVVGGGAAGCFCAIEIKKHLPDADVHIYESQDRLLAKVAVTGGGRCNLTNSFKDYRDSAGRIERLEYVYPRGHRLMKRLFNIFSPDDTVKWFESYGVRLVTQEEGCIFPKSQDAMEIVRTLERLLKERNVKVHLSRRIEDIAELKEDIKIITTGGKKNSGAYGFLSSAGIALENPCPSLFTFDIEEACLNSLSGTVVNDVILSMPATKFKSRGILLITDWGISGPATLKLSSYAARHLETKGYKEKVCINWLAVSQEEARDSIEKQLSEHPDKKLVSLTSDKLTSRLWNHIVARSGIREDIRCKEVGGRQLNKLSATLTSDIYEISGKGRFKEEFVTCGGVRLTEIDQKTLQSKKRPDIFFAGEVLDIDAITGGFNLQTAWTTGYTVAQALKSL